VRQSSEQTAIDQQSVQPTSECDATVESRYDERLNNQLSDRLSDAVKVVQDGEAAIDAVPTTCVRTDRSASMSMPRFRTDVSGDTTIHSDGQWTTWQLMLTTS
jgi:hypothetical protein